MNNQLLKKLYLLQLKQVELNKREKINKKACKNYQKNKQMNQKLKYFWYQIN